MDFLYSTSERQDDTNSKLRLPSSLIRSDINHAQEETKHLAKIIGYSSVAIASISKDFAFTVQLCFLSLIRQTATLSIHL